MKLDVKGKTISDLLSMSAKQVSRLDESSMRKYASRLVSASNKRLRRIESSGKTSKAYEDIKSKKPFFSIKDKDAKEVYEEIKEMRKFLNSRNSNIREIRKSENIEKKKREKEIAKILRTPAKKINAMTQPQLKKIMRPLANYANSLLQEFEENDEKSPAYRAVMDKAGYFEFEGTKGQLHREYIRAVNFLSMETSTLKGWQEVKERSIEKLREKSPYFTDISSVDFDEFWTLYEDLRKVKENSLTMRENKYEILEKLKSKLSKGMKFSTIINRMKKEIKKIYEREQRKRNDSSSVSRFIK